MSDRSGVGAPTHDGAEPEPTGSGEKSSPRAPAPKRRRAAELFGAALGAEPAAGSPPGVPTGGTIERGDDPSPTRSTPAASATGTAAARSTTGDAATNGDAATTTARTGARRTAARRATTSTTAVDAAREPETATVTDRPAAGALPVVTDRPVDEPAPASDPRPSRRGPLRARQVHRIIRRVDPWSVLKLALLFYLCVWLMVVISGVLIWGLAVGSGTVDSLEDFIARLLAFETFSFNADQIFRLFAMGGLILVFLGTAVSAILAVLFNLISDLIGGIRITVIEEETTRRVIRKR